MDAGGFEDFVSREQPALLRLAVLLAGDRGHAEDLVQTALLKTYRHWARISGRGEPTAYVRRVLVTTHTSWRRRLSTTEQRLMESELVARVYPALAAGDKRAMEDLLTPDFEGRLADGMPVGGGSHDGSAAMLENGWWAIGRAFDVRAEPEELVAIDRHAVDAGIDLWAGPRTA